MEPGVTEAYCETTIRWTILYLKNLAVLKSSYVTTKN